MLDPASLERLSQFPERNDPLLNLALAEEGGADVLLALARCARVGTETIDVIAARVMRDPASLTRPEAPSAGEGAPDAPALQELERQLVAHPNAPAEVRDRLLARHAKDAYFVLSAAAHAGATVTALEAAAAWPSASPLHDRPWLALLSGVAHDGELLFRWGAGDSELLREAAGRLSREGLLLEQLSRDRSRRVRRAVASNPGAEPIREHMARNDVALEVRARAGAPAHDQGAAGETFAAAIRTMQQGGVLASDVRKALLAAGPLLDEEGAFLAARYLDAPELCSLVAQAAAHGDQPMPPRTVGVGAGLGLRRAATMYDGAVDEPSLTNDIVHLVTRAGAGATRVTGKARLALFVAECLSHLRAIDADELLRALEPGTLASDRMVLSRCAKEWGLPLRLETLLEMHELPAAMVELAWRDPTIADEIAVALSGRTVTPARSGRELPEDELDLAPLCRPLPALERAVLAATHRTAVSPRAALAAIALETRRCRYVLAAMPTWRGPLTGARLSRVLKSHAGALSAAARPGAPGAIGTSVPRPAPSSQPPPSTPRLATVARWTDRVLSETEGAIAIAIGDLTVAELLRKLAGGSLRLEEGASLAAGIEARATIDGVAIFAPVVEHAMSLRTKSAAVLSLWILLESVDRVRAPSLIASAVDGLSVPGSGSVVLPAVCEALSLLERRSPGRLEHVHAQTPRGRATIASAIARAYRALGGMRDEG